MENCKVPPILNHLARDGDLLAHAGLIAKVWDDDLSECLWNAIFIPVFGQIDKNALIEIFAKAPGVMAEYKRTTEFIQSLLVSAKSLLSY